MAKKKTKRQDSLALITPKGKAMYPWLFKPNTKFHKDGRYEIDIVLDITRQDVKDFLSKIKKFGDSVCSGGKLPYKIDKEANTVTLSCKSTRAPAVIDAEKEQYEKDPSVGNGSIIKVSVNFAPYDGFGGGVTAYLNAVQVIKLVPYVAGLDGFEKEDVDDDDYDGDDSDEDSEGADGTDDEPEGAEDDEEF